jgi:hypothetical protein
METRLAGLCATLAFAWAFVACRDSSTAPQPRDAARTPNFATVSDTGGGCAGSGTQCHFVSSGNFGAVSWSFGDTLGGGGFGFGNLNVSRGGPTNNPQTFLFYFVEQCDVFFNCRFFGGSGLIPNTDLSGGFKTLHLSTNTTGNPNFFTFAGPTGLISVDWKANGFFQQRQSGTLQQDFPGFRFFSNGVSTSASANATGSVVGVSMSPDNFANIGTNTNVTINIFH